MVDTTPDGGSNHPETPRQLDVEDRTAKALSAAEALVRLAEIQQGKIERLLTVTRSREETMTIIFGLQTAFVVLLGLLLGTTELVSHRRGEIADRVPELLRERAYLSGGVYQRFTSDRYINLCCARAACRCAH